MCSDMQHDESPCRVSNGPSKHIDLLCDVCVRILQNSPNALFFKCMQPTLCAAFRVQLSQPQVSIPRTRLLHNLILFAVETLPIFSNSY